MNLKHSAKPISWTFSLFKWLWGRGGDVLLSSMSANIIFHFMFDNSTSCRLTDRQPRGRVFIHFILSNFIFLFYLYVQSFIPSKVFLSFFLSFSIVALWKWGCYNGVADGEGLRLLLWLKSLLPDRPALPRNHTHTRTRTHTCASAADRHASSTAAVTSLCKHTAACVWETVSDGVRLFVSECVWLARRVCARVWVCVCARHLRNANCGRIPWRRGGIRRFKGEGRAQVLLLCI